jgi:YD repeat-containing protein
MIGYKATHNLKCRNQEYKVGKTYTANKLEMCRHGFHFCEKMEDTLNYYTPNSDFILIEIEILGEVINEDNKSVTNKMKVLRILTIEEYSKEMLEIFPIFTYDDNHNMISKKFPDGYEIVFTYDERNNKISEESQGYWTRYEYDNFNNVVTKSYSNGEKYKYEYDDRRNMIKKICPSGYTTLYEYDERGNKISETTYPSGCKRIYEYDERNNIISETYPDGSKRTYEYGEDEMPTVLTEED